MLDERQVRGRIGDLQPHSQRIIAIEKAPHVGAVAQAIAPIAEIL
jgi:hypothetical protein